MSFPYSGLVEQPESPQIRSDKDYKYVTRIYQLPIRVTEAELQAVEALPPTGYVDDETGAIYTGYEYISEVAYPILNLNFKMRHAEPAVYSYHESSYEKPIEQHTDFLMSWRYNLLCQDSTTAVPAWAATATDEADTVGQQLWKWSTSGPDATWPYLRQKPTKAGVDSYLESSTVVTKQKVYTSDIDSVTGATKWTGAIGALIAPFMTFSLPDDDEKWIVRDVRIVESEGTYACTVEFLYTADGWDTDIYSTAGIADEGY